MIKKKPRTHNNLILPVEVRSAEELVGHQAGPGKRYVFCDDKNNPYGKLYAIVRTVKHLKTPRPHVDKHSHTVDSLWMFLGDNDDLTGLRVEITLGEESHALDSPASVYIPAGTKHTYRFLKGSGKYVNIVAVPGGEYNATVQI